MIPAAADAATWRVRADGSGNYTTIQAGLSAAVAGDTVEVGCGTYHEHQLVMKSGVLLTSETGTPDCVVIDAGQLGRGIWCSGVDSLATIRGFTITNGLATFGGGIYIGSQSRVTVERCIFRQNTADVGGGAYVHHSYSRISRCVVSANVATAMGGGLACEDDADPRFEDCSMVGNRCGTGGGGVWCYLNSDPTLRRCTITGNSATAQGGGLHAFGCRPQVLSCTVAGNSAAEGGAAALWRSTATLESSILWGNCAKSAPTLLADSSASARFTCCDVDTLGEWRSGLGVVTWTGTNFAANPLFCAPATCSGAPTLTGAYGLLPDSPCLSAGSCGRLGDPNLVDCLGIGK